MFQAGNQLRQPKVSSRGDALYSFAILEAEKKQPPDLGMQIRHLKLAKENTSEKENKLHK